MKPTPQPGSEPPSLAPPRLLRALPWLALCPTWALLALGVRDGYGYVGNELPVVLVLGAVLCVAAWLASRASSPGGAVGRFVWTAAFGCGSCAALFDSDRGLSFFAGGLLGGVTGLIMLVPVQAPVVARVSGSVDRAWLAFIATGLWMSSVGAFFLVLAAGDRVPPLLCWPAWALLAGGLPLALSGGLRHRHLVAWIGRVARGELPSWSITTATTPVPAAAVPSDAGEPNLPRLLGGADHGALLLQASPSGATGPFREATVYTPRAWLPFDPPWAIERAHSARRLVVTVGLAIAAALSFGALLGDTPGLTGTGLALACLGGLALMLYGALLGL